MSCPPTSTGAQILARLATDLDKGRRSRDGKGTLYKGNSPLRMGSDSGAFMLIVNDDGEHGYYKDYAANEGGSLYELAQQLDIALPTRAQGTVSKRAYTDLADYARAKGVPPAVFAAAGWRDGSFFCPKHEKERPAILIPTDTGIRARYIDGDKPPFRSPKGYTRCWYRLPEAIAIADRTGQPLVIVNGEPSTIVAQHWNVAATCITGGGENGLDVALLEALQDRYTGPVLIALDCDRAGRSAARTTRQQLHSGGYEVRALDLNGGKGFDSADFCRLHEGEAAAALAQLQDLPDDDPFPQPLSDKDTFPYFQGDGTAHDPGIWMHRFDKAGDALPALRLCNWTATIVAETNIHDGEQIDERYTLEATCGKRTRTIEIKRADFEQETAVRTIAAVLGAKARVAPTAQPRYILDAIKVFSNDVAERTVYSHTGWVEGRYLLGNGSIDKDGWRPEGGAQLPKRLDQYQLTPPPMSSEATALFGRLLQLAPDAVMVPLIGAVLLAPIAAQLDASSPMVHLYGTTGNHKTSVSCAAAALFGRFTPLKPTDSWTSTSNSVQRLGWHLKDAPMILDDYKAAHVKDHAVTFLLQNYGDRMARGRLDSNSEARAAYPIRATLISSGEDQPQGEASVFARILSIPVASGVVDLGHLTAIQERPELLHALGVAYVQSLARHSDPQAYTAVYRRVRSELLEQIDTRQATNPGRVISNVATLYTAWAAFGRMLREGNYWPETRIVMWLALVKRELTELARRQLALTRQERYAAVFLETLRSLLASGRAVLLDLDAEASERPPQQVVVGARDSGGVYLQTTVAFNEMVRQLRALGQPAAFTKRALAQQLAQDGLLESRADDCLMVYKRFNGVGSWCWHLSDATFFESEGGVSQKPDQPDQGSDVGHSTAPNT
jgi:hypothetical protein